MDWRKKIFAEVGDGVDMGGLVLLYCLRAHGYPHIRANGGSGHLPPVLGEIKKN